MLKILNIAYQIEKHFYCICLAKNHVRGHHRNSNAAHSTVLLYYETSNSNEIFKTVLNIKQEIPTIS